jgi:hypothetical protein
MDELKRHAYFKWHNSFSNATNDCNVFHRQIQSAINESRLAFQEMQVDTQPFPVSTIEPTSKKVLVRPKVADKGKGKNIIIGDPRMSSISQEEIARKTLDKNTNKYGGTGGRLNQAAEQNSLTRASQTVRHLRTEDLVIMRTARLTQVDSLPMTIGVSLYTKQGKRRKGKTNIAHMVGW